jgi:flagellar hook assembly protein FlgD
MLLSTVGPTWKGLARPLAYVAVAIVAAVFLLSLTSFNVAAHDRASASGDGGAARHATRTPEEAATKRAVIVVGPVGSQTADFIKDATEIADVLRTAGMNVTLIVPPNSTWKAVTQAANGADFFAYLGHGNGWPSPYPPFQEDSKDGLGLDPDTGADTYAVKYYGANKMRDKIRLAPNSIVLLHRLCYSAGNAEPGMPLPNQDVAFQRVDNYASGFLSIGARVVFALAWQPGADLARALLTNHGSMDNFFEWTDKPDSDSQYQPWHGWIGWKPDLYLDSVRTPGAVVHMDPHPTLGYLRDVTGDLSFTFDQWWGSTVGTGGGGNGGGNGGGGDGDTTPPTISDFTAEPESGTQPAEGQLPVFTPNGDGVDDTLTLTWTLSEAATVKYVVSDSSGNTVRTFTAQAAKGAGTNSWNGLDRDGNRVADGRYVVKATPTDGAGNVGDSVTTKVVLLTTMRVATAAPSVFDPNGHGSTNTQTQTVTLDHAATVDWVIRDDNGATVRTVMNNEKHAAGDLTFTWDGRSDTAQPVPNGIYWIVTSAKTARGTETTQSRITVGPFKVDVAVGSGGTVTVKLVAADAQGQPPSVKLRQSGVGKAYVHLHGSTDTHFKGKTSFGVTSGTLKVIVKGTDSNGNSEQQTFMVTLH